MFQITVILMLHFILKSIYLEPKTLHRLIYFLSTRKTSKVREYFDSAFLPPVICTNTFHTQEEHSNMDMQAVNTIANTLTCADLC